MKFKFFKKTHRTSSHAHIIASDPFKDWKIVFWVNVIVLVASGVYAAFIFIQVQHGDLRSVAKKEATKMDLLSASELNNLIANYEKKASDFEKIKDMRVTYTDPSI